ncbi:unnamed protein product [Protopolystoma xenopodis]|uniref:Uncharacterized protein n=1 Tax=Protopolystoma xenopodis TaxID=117903 RepID=A0A3S5CUS6_9PLAT|nr:unnamed protein product [Protopolystoma xenopodis]
MYFAFDLTGLVKTLKDNRTRLLRSKHRQLSTRLAETMEEEEALEARLEESREELECCKDALELLKAEKISSAENEEKLQHLI